MSDVFQQYPRLLDHEYIVGIDLETAYTVTNPDGPFDLHDVAVALLRTQGNISETARILNRSRRTTEGHIMRTPELRELLEDIQAEFLDAATSKYKHLALQGDGSALRFFLETLGKDRGFTKRNEMTGKDGEPIEMEHANGQAVLLDRFSRLIEQRRAAATDIDAGPSGNGEPPLGLGPVVAAQPEDAD